MLIIYIIVGFFAQIIDGTLGMGYGVCCRTFIKSFANIPSKVISAVVHYAEIPTSFTSMLSHFKQKNVDKKLFVNLIFTGIIGSVIGAYVIVLNFNWIEIIVDFYLISMGVVILYKGFNRNNDNKTKNKYFIMFLGFVGAFLDASGGGGWGPIVSSNLLKNCNNPRKIIGTVNSSEFFVTLSSSITFIIFIANIKKYLLVVIGLIIGGVLAAPLSAKLCQKTNDKKLYFIVGLLLIILNIYNIFILFI